MSPPTQPLFPDPPLFRSAVLPAGMCDALEHTGRGAGGEIQLTDAIASLLDTSPIDAYRFRGTRFDSGTHLGLVEAPIRFALDHEKISDAARDSRSEEHTSELQSLMRISYAVFCLNKQNKRYNEQQVNEIHSD